MSDEEKCKADLISEIQTLRARIAALEERKLEHDSAETALQQSEERFRNLVGSMDDLVFTVDREGRYTEFFRRWLERSGYKAEQLLGKTACEILGTEAGTINDQANARALKGERVVYEWSVTTDRGTFHFHTSLSPIRDQNGEIVGLVGVGRNITERKLAEAQRLFQASLLDQVRNAVLATDLEGRITYWNKFAEHMYQWKAEEVIGRRTVDVVIPKTEGKRLASAFRELQETGYWQGEFLVQRKDGCTFPVFAIDTLLKKPDGEPTGVGCVSIDITERKTAEAALRESEERFRTYYNNLPIPTFTWRRIGEDFFLADCNEAAVQFTKGKIGKLVGVSARDTYEDMPEIVEDMSRCFAERSAFKREMWYRLRTTGESKYLDAHHVYVPPDLVTVHAEDITERKQREDELRTQKEILQKIFDHIPVMIRFRDEDGRVRVVNHEWQRVLGWTLEELQQRDSDILAEAYPDPAYRGRVSDFITAATGEWMDFKTKTKDGRVIDTNWSSIRLSDGTLMGFGQDVTGRNRAEAALRESEQKYRDLFSFAPLGIYQSRQDGTLITANAALATILGYDSVADLLKINLTTDAYVNEGERKRLIDRYEPEGHVADLEVQWKRKEGAPIWIQLSAHAVKDPQGVTQYFEGFVRDITEQKRAEKARQSSARRYRDLVELTHDLVWAVDAQGRITYMSPASRRFYGREPDEMVGHFYNEFVPPDQARLSAALLEKILATGEVTLGFENRVLRKDGSEVILLTNAVVLHDEAGNAVGTAGTAQDITERRRAEETLQRQAAQLATLHEIELEISAESELSRVLDVVTRRAGEMLNATHCNTYICDREGGGLTLVASIDKYEFELQLKAGEGLAGVAVLTGSAQLIDDYNAWPGRAAVFEGTEFGPALGAPLKWQQTVIGAISIARERAADPFTMEELHFLEQIAAEAAIAIHQATLFEEVQDGHSRLRVLSHKLIDAQETERKHISRELHDQVGQALTALQINLQGLQYSLDKGVGADQLSESLTIVEDTLGQVHDLSLELRPSLLDDLGLVAALRWYLDRVADRAGLLAWFEAGSLRTRLPSDIETACFRIAQEALTNVVRHASAKTVWVELTHSDSRLELSILDDGAGFDVRGASRLGGTSASLGLEGMRERTAAAGGKLKIRSSLGQGTEVRARFSLTGPADREQSNEKSPVV